MKDHVRLTRLFTAIVLLVAGVLADPRLVAQTGPALAIQPSGTNLVQVAWPADANFDVLQELLGFSTTNYWRDISDAPVVFGPRYGIFRNATNSVALYRLVSRGIPGSSTPPDPATTATAPARNIFNDLASLTAFLYSGSNAEQVGIVAGVIDPIRASVLRGKATKRDGSPLVGVRVALVNHPEFGYTFTRTDGMFDLAVNAGLYTVDYQAIGYCPAQRQVQAPIQDFRTLKDVVMVGLDGVANPITFGSNAPPQMAHSSVITDADGARSVSLLFPAGTCASLLMPDGTTQACGGLTIRATEFTVGTNGPAGMPAPLPATSAYTYCAEISGDEALDAGASTIMFNQTVWGYLDNFLGITVGAAVPAGSYDRKRGTWVPESNGRVIEILGVTNGLAQVDLDGSGVAADSDALAANQFRPVELQQLAANYPTGKTLWRMPMAHFTAIDWNFGFSANGKSPNTPGDSPKTQPCDTSPNDYGTVNYSSQVFQESIPLVGVPMALHYSSARVPGYRVLAELKVPVVAGFDSVSGPVAAGVRYEVAGVVSNSYWSGFNNIPNYTAISWDGYDAYGRYVGGTRHAACEVDFYYPLSYYGNLPIGSVVENFPLFGNFGNQVIGAGHTASGLYVRSSVFDHPLTIPDHRKLGLGGWSLTPHHSYDPDSQFLYLGDGRMLKPQRLGNGVNPVLNFAAFAGQGAGALNVAAGADGTQFFYGNNMKDGGFQTRLFKRTPAGNFVNISAPNNITFPGSIVVGEDWSSADGQPGTNVFPDGGIGQIKAGPDGSLYVRTGFSIARIDASGKMQVVLGMGTGLNYAPDGTLARAAHCQPSSGEGFLAVGSDGTVYFDDAWSIQGTNYTFIRKVASDGRIYTIMGQAGPPNGTVWRGEVGKPADQFRLARIQGLAVGPDDSIYVSPSSFPPDEGGIYKITPSGMTELVMVNIPITTLGNEGDIYLVTPGVYYAGDEGSSAVAPTSGVSGGGSVRSLQFAPDGSLLFLVDWSLDTELWKINPNGIRERLAGRGVNPVVTPPAAPAAGGNPLDISFYYTQDFAVGPDNGLTLVSQGPFQTGGNLSVAQIGPSLPGFNATDLQIPSEDGSELYVFDEHGTHLATLNGLTGATSWSFAYDANNLVTGLTDGNGLVTHIQRDGAGTPTAIVGPYGQRTTLSVDANGFLNQVSNPANEKTTLVSTGNGLLTSITGPLNDSYSVTYDADGLVTQVRDPLGGGLDLIQTLNSGSQVNVQSSTTLTNVQSRLLTLLPSGDTKIAYSVAGGTPATYLVQQSGHQSVQSSNVADGEYDFSGDPRFPQATRLLSSESLTLPGGLTGQLKVSRSTTLSDPNNSTAVFAIATITNQATLNGQVYTTTYNGTNRVAVSTSPEGRRVTSGLDTRGRLIHAQSSGETPVDISYDAQGRVSEVDDTATIGIRRTTFAYDSLGQLELLTDPLGRTNHYSYDGAGRLQQLTLADGQIASFQSDAEYNLTSVTPPGRSAHHFGYNVLGLITNYTPPVVNGLNESVGYQYDADRALTRVALPDGQNIVFTRGPASRIDQLVLGAGPALTYAYDPQTGLLTNVVSTAGDSLEVGYQGSFPVTVAWSGSITGKVALTLNSDFLSASQAVNGTAIAFAYNHDRLLIQAGSLTLTRNTNGFVSGSALGVVTDARQFDDRGLLTNYIASVGSTSVWSATLSYDLINRITNKIETLQGVTRTLSYSYDGAGRLANVRLNGALVTTYTYDANGNRLSRNSESATYDAQDRVQTYAGTSLGWSLNGELHTSTFGGQTTTYTYNVLGALTAVVTQPGQQIEYLIDGAGRRIGKKINGSLVQGFLYQSLLPVAELDASNQIVSRFIYASKPNVPDYLIKGASTYRLISDERGSVRLVINMADGSIIQRLDYDEFGRVTLDSAPGFQPFGYAGGLYDTDTGLVRFGLRDYSPLTGQWTSRDPVSFNGGQLALYSYLGNDPVNFIDPVGLGPWYRLGGGLLTLGGGVLAILAAPEIIASSAVIGSIWAIGAVVTVGTGAANTAVAFTTPATLPTSLPGVVALGTGNSPTAQRTAAVADLAFGFGIGKFAPNALSGTAKVLSDANDAVGAVDKTATSYGLTPGSAPPCQP